jgi:CubicO group peptidase (beta-lactamase class C family)
VPPKGNDPSCGRAQFFEWFTRRHPIFAPSTTPIYGNVAFQLLAYALEDISGKPFSALLEEEVLRPLDLSRTSTTRPLDESGCIVPGAPACTFWDFDLGEVGP